MAEVVQLLNNTVDADAPDKRAHDFASTIELLFRELPLPVQERVYAQLSKVLRPIPAPRAGDVLGAVIHLFPKRPEWTVQQLIESLEAAGVEHTPKAVYNALGYLRRKDKIQKTGHGRYTIGGIPIVTSDDLGGAPTKDEQHDPN